MQATAAGHAVIRESRQERVNCVQRTIKVGGTSMTLEPWYACFLCKHLIDPIITPIRSFAQSCSCLLVTSQSTHGGIVVQTWSEA
jgi:hypothetical protein